eukprot:1139180-Pelagomonas_calceolata.AAC.5
MVSAVLWQPCIKLPALLEARPLERAAALPCSAQRVDRKGAGAQSPPPLFWTASVQTAAASAPAKAAPAAAGFLHGLPGSVGAGSFFAHSTRSSTCKEPLLSVSVKYWSDTKIIMSQ